MVEQNLTEQIKLALGQHLPQMLATELQTELSRLQKVEAQFDAQVGTLDKLRVEVDELRQRKEKTEALRKAVEAQEAELDKRESQLKLAEVAFEARCEEREARNAWEEKLLGLIFSNTRLKTQVLGDTPVVSNGYVQQASYGHTTEQEAQG